MISYIALHVLFGVVAGMVLIYLKSSRRLTRTKAWFAYLTGIGICLGIAALIGELSKQWQVEELYKWIGTGAVLLSFFGTVSIGARLPGHRNKPKAQ
jgi:peptidoglycan/LPS O-acetylase OafA/YrhL